MYITGIGKAVLELSSFKVESWNHQRESSYLEIFGNLQKYEAYFTKNDVTYDRSQF